MMSFELLVRKLLMDKERYLSEEKLKEHCKKLDISYVNAIKYLGKYHYIKRIVRGFFYVPTIEERKLKTGSPSPFEAIAKAMEYKKVKNWYFGLETAIKMNAITHEVFTIDYVVSDTIFRAKPIVILGSRVKFVKLNKKLFGFGIKKTAGGTPYSDLEKTILDLIHLKKHAGRSNRAIRDLLIEWADEADKNKLKKYSKHYSESVRKALEELK
jgi:hypothetical protein